MRPDQAGQMQAALDNSPDIIAVFDRQLRHILVNRAVERATGTPASTYISKTNQEMGGPDELNKLWDGRLAEAFQTGLASELAFPFPGPDGTRYYRGRLVPLLAEDGSVASVMAITTDVTEREQARLQLEVERARLDTLVQHLPVAVILAEAPSGRMILHNEAVDRIWHTSLPLAQAPGDYRQYVGFHRDGRRYTAAEWPLMRSVRTGEIVRDEQIEIERGDGSRGCVSVSSAPIRDPGGSVVAAVAVFEDITEKQELARLKQALVTAAAQDLKTPLTAVKGLVQLLRHELAQLGLPETDNVRVSTAIIDRATQRMAALIDELLDATQLDPAAGLELKPVLVNLVDLARRVVDNHPADAGGHRPRLDSRVASLAGMWDAPRLERALSSLVEEAVRASPNGGEIVVRVWREEEAGQRWAAVAVEHECRGQAAPEGEGQTGLAFAREVLQRHGGELLTHREPGRGSRFLLRLPLPG